jgi:hypothetical protein
MPRFWCQHHHQTTPRRDEDGEYRRCLDCGERLAWSWPDQFSIQPPRRMQSPVRPRAAFGWKVERKSA